MQRSLPIGETGDLLANPRRCNEGRRSDWRTRPPSVTEPTLPGPESFSIGLSHSPPPRCPLSYWPAAPSPPGFEPIYWLRRCRSALLEEAARSRVVCPAARSPGGAVSAPSCGRAGHGSATAAGSARCEGTGGRGRLTAVRWRSCKRGARVRCSSTPGLYWALEQGPRGSDHSTSLTESNKCLNIRCHTW